MLPDLNVPRETREKLRAYAAFTLKWNKSINLIGPAEAPSFWERHVLDCLQLTPLVPKTAEKIVDLGSGAGLPGLVLAIATGLNTTLIEADQRKAAFLYAASVALAVSVTILPQRMEVADLAPAPIITARALAPLSKLLALAAPKLAPNGICLFMKGQNAERELTLAQGQWQMKIDRFASRTSPQATILRLSEIRPSLKPR